MSVLDEVQEFRHEQQQVCVENAPVESQSFEEGQGGELQPIDTAEQTQDLLAEAMKDKLKDSSDIKELTRDVTYIKGASDLQTDTGFKDTYQTVLAKQLIEDLKQEGKRTAIQQSAKKIEARNIRNQAFYSSCKPIFRMLDIEEAYGLVPMIITVSLLMIPFLVVSLMRFIVNAVNSLFVAISGFKKPAFWICTIIVIIAITLAVILALLFLIDLAFGTHILLKVKDVVR